MPFISIEVFLNKGLYVEVDFNKTRPLFRLNRDKMLFNLSDYGLVFSGPDAEMNRMFSMYNDFDQAGKLKAYQLQSIAFDPKKDLGTRLNALKEVNVIFEEIETRFLEQNPFESGWILANERKSYLYGMMFNFFLKKQLPQKDTLTAALAHQPSVFSSSTMTYYLGLAWLMAKWDSTFAEQLKSSPISPLRADLLMLYGSYDEMELRKKHLNNCLPAMSSDWCKQVAQDELTNKEKQTQQINERLEKVVVKNQAAGPGRFFAELDNGARLYLNESKNVDSLIQRVRAMYPGEAVIFDLWATWCGPCIEDMKNSKAKKEELKKLGVQVLYLGVESRSSEEAWKKKILEHSFTGEHIWLGPASQNIMREYGLTGFPSYLFFDRAGKYHPKLVHFIQHIDLEEIKKRL
jgi:thiol-disulfide isomerase/thioredoxin